MNDFVKCLEEIRNCNLETEKIKYIINNIGKFSVYEVSELSKELKYDSSRIKLVQRLKEKGYTAKQRVSVIKNYKYDKTKLELLQNNKTAKEYMFYFEELVGSLKYDTSKKSLINQYEELNLDKNHLMAIINLMMYDKTKLECISKDNIKRFKYTKQEIIKVIENLNDDINIIKFLDEKTIESLEFNSSNISLLISKIKDDQLKLKIIKKLEKTIEPGDKIKIISTLKDDDIKLKILKKENESYKLDTKRNRILKIATNLRILSSLQNPDLLIPYIQDKKSTIPNSIKEINPYKDILLLGLLKKPNDVTNEMYKKIKNICGIKDIDIPQIPSNMTVGIELEAVGNNNFGNTNAVLLRKLRNLFAGYTAKRDGSLRGYNNNDGVEVISPVLHNEDLKFIPIVSSIMQKNGLFANNTCGGHIHVGAEYLETVEHWKNFFELYNNCEDIFYKVSNSPGEKPRKGMDVYAKPISNKINNSRFINILKEGDITDFITKLKKVETDKYNKEDRRHGLNLTNVNNPQKNTIEFRMFNGTLDYQNIFDNLRLCTRLLEVSKKLGDIEIAIKNGGTLTEEQKVLIEKRKKLIYASKESEASKKDAFLKLLFPNIKERVTYEIRYQASKSTDFTKIFKEKTRYDESFFRDIYSKERKDTTYKDQIKELRDALKKLHKERN